MAFAKPLDFKEKYWIVHHPDVAPGKIAKTLGRLFKRYNGGARSAFQVINFRAGEEYKRMLGNTEIKQA